MNEYIRKIGLKVCLMAWLLCPATCCLASEIIIVPSSTAAPYQQAKDALEKQLSLDKFTARVLMLDELAKKPDSFIDKDTQAIVAIGSKAAVWLHKKVPSTVQLAYCMVSDPISSGLKNPPLIHGIDTAVPLESQFKLIAEAIPGAQSIGMLYFSKKEKGKNYLKKVHSHIPKGWRVEAVAIDEFESVAEAIDHLFTRKIDIVWTSPDSSIYNTATVRKLLLTSVRSKIPVFGFSSSLVKAGCLMGVSVDQELQGRQAAELIRQLLRPRKGVSLQSLEDVQFRIILNQNVAELLSIEFPKSLISKSRR